MVFLIYILHYIEAATLIFLIGQPSFQLDFDVVQVVHGQLVLAQQVLSLFAYNFHDSVVVSAKVFLRDEREFLSDGGVIPISRGCELVAALQLLFDGALALLQALLQLLDMILFRLVEGLRVDYPSVALAEDVELAEAEGHVEHNPVCILTSVACVGQL